MLNPYCLCIVDTLYFLSTFNSQYETSPIDQKYAVLTLSVVLKVVDASSPFSAPSRILLYTVAKKVLLKP